MGVEMSEEIKSVLEHAHQFVLQHVPADLLQEALPFGVICLVAGIGLSVLGAKLSRFGFVCAFSVAGGYAGAYFARQTGFSSPVCIAAGALMIGVIGYQTFRLWVGLLAAVVFTSAALGVFGYQRVMPHVAEFERTVQAEWGLRPVVLPAPANADGSPSVFTLPSPEHQQAYRNRSPRQWAGELWRFVTQKDALAGPNVRALAIVAMVAGLCLGVLAVRWALIVSTSLLGTGLVTTAIATLLTHSAPESYEAFQQRPGLIGIGVGAFLVASLVLQTLLTRKAPASKAESKADS